jgi:ATP-dependent Lhr-like helicase
VYVDTERQTIKAREGSAMLLYSSGGSIPDRGYYAMRLADGGTKIGELDEEFVFELRVGNSFMLGVQAWRIVSIGDEAVTVAPLDRAADFVPFWKAEKASRGASVSKRMLEHCAKFQLDPVSFKKNLSTKLGFSSSASEALCDYLASQARSQGKVPLPCPSGISVELFRDPSQKADMTSIVVHTLRGAAINEALGIALAASMSQRLGMRVDRLSDDDSILLVTPLVNENDAEKAMHDAFVELADSAAIFDRIRGGLAESGSFGAAFRENAGRALLLPRAGFRKRMPLWVTRLRAKKLYDRTVDFPDFPIVAETWKTILEGRFDLPGLVSLCSCLADGSMTINFFRPRSPSPFALHAGWSETNRYLYEGDELSPQRNAEPGAANQAIQDALENASLRPVIPQELALSMGSRLRREAPGWAPETADELADWVDERVMIPMDEWETLLTACPQELAASARLAIADPHKAEGILARLLIIRLPGAAIEAIARRERQSRLITELEQEPGRVMAEWLKSTGPVPLSRLRELFGLSSEESVAAALQSRRNVETGDLGGMGGQSGTRAAIDTEALEALLRQTRKAARPTVTSKPAAMLQYFIQELQGLRNLSGNDTGTVDGVAATRKALTALSGFPAPAGLWETQILPARVEGYRPEYLDELLSNGEFLWFGTGPRSLAFCPLEEYEAFARSTASVLIRSGTHPVDAWQIKDSTGLPLAELEEKIWEEAWCGAISSTSFEPVRRAAAAGFKRISASAGKESSKASGLRQNETRDRRTEARRRIPLALAARWRSGAPIAGTWFALTVEDGQKPDRAGELELATTRVRAVIRRYGIIVRAILGQELPEAAWSALFPAIRRLELAGELIAGRFFDGIDGLQFMGRDAFSLFMQGTSPGRIYSLNACDPASLAGTTIPDLSSALDTIPCLSPEANRVSIPSRLVSNHFCALDGELACVSRRSYHELDIALQADDPRLKYALQFLLEAKRRTVHPERRIVVSRINGEAAAITPYADTLLAMGFEADRGILTLW